MALQCIQRTVNNDGEPLHMRGRLLFVYADAQCQLLGPGVELEVIADTPIYINPHAPSVLTSVRIRGGAAVNLTLWFEEA